MRRRPPPKPRNPVALPARRLKSKVKPSLKLYRRRPKHRGPEGPK
jgi:hypothetical protein